MGELGNREPALGMLAKMHARFDEGLSTRDLKEAKALMVELSRNSHDMT